MKSSINTRPECGDRSVAVGVLTVTSALKELVHLEEIRHADFFIMENEDGKTRGHPYKIHKLHSRLES